MEVVKQTVLGEFSCSKVLSDGVLVMFLEFLIKVRGASSFYKRKLNKYN